MSNKYLSILSDQVNINKNKLEINTSKLGLSKLTKYNLIIPSGVITDINNNPISNNEYIFETIDFPMLIDYDFTNITNSTELYNHLITGVSGISSDDIILSNSSVFDYSNGVAMRSGTCHTNNNTTTVNWVNSNHNLTIKNCLIPKRIYIKCHVTQTANTRYMGNISIKTANSTSCFVLIHIVDASVEYNSSLVYGLIVDAKAPWPNILGVNRIPLIKGYQEFETTLDIDDCPNFKEFISDTTQCDIIWQNARYYNDKDTTRTGNPIYLEKLRIEF